MQQFKQDFRNTSLSGKTTTNVQSCIRTNDIESIGDGTHLGLFQMMGLFSFRHWTVPQTVDFWYEYLSKLGITPTHCTIHPDRPEWSQFHKVPVRLDPDCLWSDGGIGGYCTEFYVGDLEIGNIVNPLGTCIDVGFGLERLDFVVNQTPIEDGNQHLLRMVQTIIDSGVLPSNTGRGYVLRRLLRKLVQKNLVLEHPLFREEQSRQLRNLERYHRLLPKHQDKTPQWWKETHGVDIDLLG
jgi:alanyl-tRNA synthetase